MLQVIVYLKSGEQPEGGYLEIDEDASDEVITASIRRLLNTRVEGGWIAIGDVVTHVQAIEAIEPR